jgi:hypothetical protein
MRSSQRSANAIDRGGYQPSVTRMIVFPDTGGASGPDAAGASANSRTAPTFEVSRPSRSRGAVPPDHRTTVSAARFKSSIGAIDSVTQSRMMT